jgi:hypothetical protein
MPELIPIFLFLSVAAVMILRPLTKRLGLVVEQIARDRNAGRADDAEMARIRFLVEQTNKRLELIEERLDFTERLVGNRRASRALPTDGLGHPHEAPRYEEHSYLAR